MTERPRTLAEYIRANSYRRAPIKARKLEGHSRYKKGDEFRIIVRTVDDSRELRELLLKAGFSPGKALRKAQRWAVPVYGKSAVRALLKLKARRRK